MTLVPLVQDPAVFVDEPMVFRRMACPSCQLLIAVDIARATDPLFPELRLS